MDCANQAAILILRSCRDATHCDQEANEKKGLNEVTQVVHGCQPTDPRSSFREFTMNGT
jgi:hypothetical protein